MAECELDDDTVVMLDGGSQQAVNTGLFTKASRLVPTGSATLQ